MISLSYIRVAGVAFAMMASGMAEAKPACDAVKAALAGDQKTFAKKMIEVYPRLDRKACTSKNKKQFLCMDEFKRQDAVKMFGASSFDAIATTAGAPFVRCGATLDDSTRYKDGLTLILKVPSGKRTAIVEVDAYIWEDDPDYLSLDIEVK